MASREVDHLGQWTTTQTFPTEGLSVGPDGALIEPWEGEQLSGAHSSVEKPTDEPETQNGATFNGAFNTGETFDYIEPIPLGEDPELPLNSRDVCAFIVNKMIGTGIFVQPPAVLLLTRSKGEALGLWVIGFVYTLIRYERVYSEYADLTVVI